MNPVMLLDVDGVLNALSHQQQYRAIWVPARDREWKIRYSIKVIDRITALSEQVDIKWCTTWEMDAVHSLAPYLKLPEFGIVEKFGTYDKDSWDCLDDGWWKYTRFVKECRDGKRVVWLDDDISDAILQQFPESEDELLIRPNSNSGLTLKDLDRIEAWV